MAMVRGTGLVYARDFVLRGSGEEAWRALVRSLSPADARAITSAVPRGWYDLRLLALVERGIAETLGGGDLSVLRSLGRFEAERDLDDPMRWFFRVVPPDLAIRHIDLYWRRFHDSGRWTSEAVPGGVVARLFDWGVVDAALCATLTGYLGRVLELIGSPVTIEHRRCRAQGAACCELAWSWQRRSAVPARSAVGPRDVMEIGRELSQIPDRTALAQAITCLLVTVLGFRRAVLWEGEPHRGEALARAGAAQPAEALPHRFVLEARGSAHGCLEVEAAGDEPPWETLEQLLPWMGIAFAGVPRPSAARAARVEAARAAWKLTARQVDVLARVARGMANKEIAADMGVNEGTVEIHVSHLLRKAGADNRASLLARLWA